MQHDNECVSTSTPDLTVAFHEEIPNSHFCPLKNISMLGGRSASKVPQRKKKALTNQEQVTSVQLPPSGWSVKEAWTQGPQLGNCRTDTMAQGAHRIGRGRGQPERWGQRQARLAQNHGRGCCRRLAGAPSRCCCWNRVIPQRKRGERQTLAFSW